MGPNERALMIHCLALIAVPVGGAGFADGIEFLSSKERIADGTRKARQQVAAMLFVVKATPDNPWGDDDEAIAGEILRRIEERKEQMRQSRTP